VGGAAPAAPAAPEPVVGAVPEVEQARPAPPAAPAHPEEGPFAAPGGARVDLASEAAALAAEAAAVRALDSGPLTPPPDLLAKAASEALPVSPVTEPEPIADSAASATPPPAVEDLASAPASDAPAEPEMADEIAPPTPAPVTSAPPTPPPPTPPPPTPAPATSAPATSARSGANGHPALQDDEMAEAVTPPPQPVAAAQAKSPPPVVAEPVAAAPRPEAPIEADAPAPASAEVTGALPATPLDGGGSGASAERVLVATDTELERTDPRAPIPVDVEASEPEIEADDPLEVVEGTPPPDGAPKTVRTRTPPPIPGSYYKTPGPEPIAPPPAPGEDGAGPLLPGLSILPEALAQRPRRPKRSKPWFEEVFDEDYLRTLPFMRADQTLREVEFISETLRLGSGMEVLDVACGYGRHAIELVQRGVAVTGLDLSLPLLIRAADEAQRRGLQVNFVHADMREMAFERQFDGAYSMLTSFGYFDEETNLRVAERVARALKPGARFLLDIVNRDYVVSDLPVRVWWEGTGCVVLEEVDFNFHTSRILTHRSIVFEDGRQLEQEISVRAYSLHEIGRLLRQAGFRVIDVSGALATRGHFFGTSSRNLLIVAEKREEDVT
jgi:SAM-dependent methyltransferase